MEKQASCSCRTRLLHPLAGYVEQFDTLLPELTVREMLLYTAELKCPRSEPISAKKIRVEQLLETLALKNCAGTLIGDALARGVSGGQVRTRLCSGACVAMALRSAAPRCSWDACCMGGQLREPADVSSCESFLHSHRQSAPTSASR